MTRVTVKQNDHEGHLNPELQQVQSYSALRGLKHQFQHLPHLVSAVYGQGEFRDLMETMELLPEDGLLLLTHNSQNLGE